MPKLTPTRGGGFRLTPTGDGDYTSEPITYPDPLEGASAEERAFFITDYGPISMLEMCRRLRQAEWNAQQWQESLDRAKAEIRELRRQAVPEDRSAPPAGWELPKPAVDLLECVERHGWVSATAWGERSNGDPMVRIQLAHGGWRFDHLTWVASGSGTSMKRLGRGLQSTPEFPAWHDAPSVKAIRAVIEANPATAQAA
ncbi:hypothetical protein ACWGCW_00685 [Streptomyces sp. NPDC054933]